jgi:hypothetical protein
MNRNLDNVFFRDEVDGKWVSVCFTDMTSKGAESVLLHRTDEWYESLYERLHEVLKDIDMVLKQYDDYNSDAVLSAIKEIEKYNGWTFKILMLRSLIRYIGNTYDLVCGEPEDE